MLQLLHVSPFDGNIVLRSEKEREQTPEADGVKGYLLPTTQSH